MSSYSNMKYFTVVFVFFFCKASCFAQAVYMHEAAEDAKEGGGFFDAIEGLAGIATVLMFAAFAFIVIFAIIPSKIDDVKFDRKYKRRKNLLEDEARRIILNKLDSPMYRKINSNQCFKQWFLDGYVNGVDDGGERKVYKPYSTEYEIISIEEYVKRRGFEHLRQELIGGDVEFSKTAFTEGIKQGSIRRERHGDARELLK